MSNDMLFTLAKEGLLGLLLTLALFAIYKLANKCSTVEEKRTTDAQNTVQVLLTLSERWNTSIQANTAATEQLQQAVTSMERTQQIMMTSRGSS